MSRPCRDPELLSGDLDAGRIAMSSLSDLELALLVAHQADVKAEAARPTKRAEAR
jgi:hypothetical protein